MTDKLKIKDSFLSADRNVPLQPLIYGEISEIQKGTQNLR